MRDEVDVGEEDQVGDEVMVIFLPSFFWVPFVGASVEFEGVLESNSGIGIVLPFSSIIQPKGRNLERLIKDLGGGTTFPRRICGLLTQSRVLIRLTGLPSRSAEILAIARIFFRNACS